MKIILSCLTLLFLVGCATTGETGSAGSESTDAYASEAQQAAAKAAPQMTLGNGENNWITVDDITRCGNTLTISELEISDDGWLVVHPYTDGKPDGSIYVGATFVKKGNNKNIDVDVDRQLETGTPLIVMLHYDANKNGEFDFVFVDERSVVDRAVFEGTTMISHRIKAP